MPKERYQIKGDNVSEVGMLFESIMLGMMNNGVIESTAIFEEPCSKREFEIQFRLLKDYSE